MNFISFIVTSRNFLFVKWKISGGYEFAERQIVAFIPDAFCLYEEREFSFPITVLEIKPCSLRFAEQLTHRDYLGAVLNLGIDRGKIGDILTEEGRALLFCKPSVKDIICRELCRVRHTTVSVRETDERSNRNSYPKRKDTRQCFFCPAGCCDRPGISGVKKQYDVSDRVWKSICEWENGLIKWISSKRK